MNRIVRTGKIKGVPKPMEQPFGQCDWGDCNSMAIDWRCDNKMGWLPVCENHLPTPAKGKSHHRACPGCGHIWSVKGHGSEVARQHCDECGWDWKNPNPPKLT